MSEAQDMEGVHIADGFVRRPLLGVAVAFIAGMVLHLHFPLRPLAGFAWSVAALTVALAATWRRDREGERGERFRAILRNAFLLAAVAVTGWAAAGMAPSDFLQATDPTAEEPADGQRVEVVGIVAGDPETPVLARGSVWTFPMQVENFADERGARGFRGLLRVRLRAFPGAEAPTYGERWKFEGRIAVRSARTPEWRYILTVGRAGSRRLSAGHGNRAEGWCYDARRRAGDMLSAGVSDRPETAGVLRALMLGYRSDLDPDLHALFIATGTLHIFAISGSHIVILAGLVLVVLGALRVPRLWWGAAIVPLLAGFTVAIGAEASAVRACVMASVYWMAPLFGRRPDTLSALALSALLILGVDPKQLTDAGFVFSFAVVLGLIVLHPLLDRRLRPLWQADPLRIQEERRIVRWMRTGGKYAAGLVSMTLVAWAVSTPITACWFGRFTSSALPANLVIVPMTALVMLSGCMSLLLGQVWMGFAEIFNNASLGLLEAMLWILRRLQGIPAGNVEVAPWSAWLVLAWYAVLAAWAYIEQVKQDGHAAAGSGTMDANSPT